MFHNKNPTGIQKQFPNNINKVLCTICNTEKMTTLPKGKTVDTTNLQPVEIIHMDLDFYNVTSIRGFNSMLNVVCANTIML